MVVSHNAIMDEIYLGLLSDSSMDIYPKNKQFSFTTKLNHPIQVQKEQWVVPLVEIMTPSEEYITFHIIAIIFIFTSTMRMFWKDWGKVK